MEDIETIRRLYALSEAEILVEIGNEILAGESRFFPPSNQEAIENAVEWLRERYELLQGKICTHPKLQEYCSSDDIMLAAAIADLISGMCINVSPFSVAVLLVKKGIDELCKQTKEKSS